MSAQDQAGDGFRPRTVAVMLMIGLLGFVATLLLGAYAPDMQSGRNGGTHALSNAATGFSGLYRLAEATGRDPRILRSDQDFDTDELIVFSPPTGTIDVSGPAQRRNGPTLMILPKWDTKPDPGASGWVRYTGLYPAGVPEGVLAPKTLLKVSRHPSGGVALVAQPGVVDADGAPIRFRAPRPLQTIAHPELIPVITDPQGRIVVGQFGPTGFYILADPDLLSNRGMKDAGQARAALALLDYLQNNGVHGVAFDVTLNGLGGSRSPLKLLFDPPFLTLTLAIAAALLLAGLHALGRFGPAQARARAIAFGKTALVDNTAALVRKAGREAMMGGRYVQVIRERAVRAFGVPARLRDAALDAYLDKLGKGPRFTDLAAAADDAQDTHALLAAARALHHWQQEKHG